jgi:hypothetical protein
MSSPYPDWDASDPSRSLRRTAEWFVEEARTTFLTDGTHVELFFLFKEDGGYSMGPPPPDMPKDQFVAVLRQRIRDDNTYGVVHICQAWAYVPKHPNDHTYRQILDGEIAVSELKRGDKTEALVVRYECRDGAQRMWISPVVRTKDGVALADALELGEQPEGRFGSLF